MFAFCSSKSDHDLFISYKLNVKKTPDVQFYSCGSLVTLISIGVKKGKNASFFQSLSKIIHIFLVTGHN